MYTSAARQRTKCASCSPLGAMGLAYDPNASPISASTLGIGAKMAGSTSSSIGVSSAVADIFAKLEADARREAFCAQAIHAGATGCNVFHPNPAEAAPVAEATPPEETYGSFAARTTGDVTRSPTLVEAAVRAKVFGFPAWQVGAAALGLGILGWLALGKR